MGEPEETCPYCDSSNLEVARWYRQQAWFVRCKDCKSTGPAAMTAALAVELFDRRKEPGRRLEW